MSADYDFHPDESTVRVFTTAASGVLHLDDDVAITEAVTSGVVLRHYAFGDRWFKINVTTDQQGGLVETGAPQQRFAFNCDIATPMERDGNAMFAVDLFVDVLVRADLRSIHVGDQDEFEQALSVGLVSHAEGEQARRGVGWPSYSRLFKQERSYRGWMNCVRSGHPSHPKRRRCGARRCPGGSCLRFVAPGRRA